jgi:hypothetical protein
MLRVSLACLVVVAFFESPLLALEHVTIKREGKTIEVTGKIEVEAQDGGVMLLAADGVLWPIVAEEIVSKTSDAAPFKPLTKEELGPQLMRELPAGFKIHQTQHYLIAYNTSEAYAKWVGALYERLYRGFYTYWEHRGWKLAEPEFPLVAIVFDTQENYAAYARTEIGEGTKTIIGYYSLQSNKMTMYDLTGVEGAKFGNDKNAAGMINRILLSQPAAERTVATIVHEATHQLAFNSGMHVRFSDLPFWVSEGLAVYFESPDLKNAKGWSTIGAVNRFSLLNFRKFSQKRTNDGFELLLTDDKRFRDPAAAADAYAEAWALTYFLQKTKPEQYTRYLKALSKLPTLGSTDPADRRAKFKAAFGEDTAALEQEFLRFMRNVD